MTRYLVIHDVNHPVDLEATPMVLETPLDRDPMMNLNPMEAVLAAWMELYSWKQWLISYFFWNLILTL